MARNEADGETERRMIAGHGMPCPYGNDEEFITHTMPRHTETANKCFSQLIIP